MQLEETGIKFQKNKKVFYNPSQELNRQISLLLLRTLSPNFTLLDCMAATGIRGILYLKNLALKLTLNDISEDACHLIHQNLKSHNLNCTVTNEDCRSLMLNNHFDVIDIDPFGSPMPFLNAAFVSVRHKGILCITATDTAVLCGNRKKCWLKYSVLTKRTQAYQEIGIRAFLGAIATEAGKMGCSIQPLLSVSVDFYFRVFVRVYRKLEVQTCFVYHCYCLASCNKVPSVRKNYRKESMNDRKESINDRKESINDKIDVCEFCKDKIELCGPYFEGPIHNINIIDEMIKLSENEKLTNLLKVIRQEFDYFGFYNLNYMTKLVGISSQPLSKVFSVIKTKGYDIRLVHSSMMGVKTNMPFFDLLSVLKEIDESDIKADKEIAEYLKGFKNRGLTKNGTGPLKK